MSTPYDKPDPGPQPVMPFQPVTMGEARQTPVTDAGSHEKPAGDEAPRVQINGALATPAPGGSFAPQVMGAPPGGSFAPQVMAAPFGGTTGSFAPQVMGPPPAGGTTAFAPQVMGPPPAGGTTAFAPQVMGAPPGAPGSFAPQVMGGTSGSFAPQVMGSPPAATPFAPVAAPALAPPVASPGAAQPATPAMVAPAMVMPPAHPAQDPADPPPPAMGASIAGMSNGGGVATPPAAGLVEPPAMAVPAGGAAAEDDGLAASPWNTANNPGFNRALLPSALVAASEPSPPSKKRAELAPEVPSRTPWVIVGVLILVAIAGGVAVFLIHGRQSGGGQIAVPAGGSTATADDTTTDPAAPSVAPTASAVATARPVPTYRPVAPVVRPRPTPNTNNGDDPYADPGGRSRQSPAPGTPHRIFGTDN